MPWAPIHTVFSDAGFWAEGPATFADSTVTMPDQPDGASGFWEIYLPRPARVRVTVNSYKSISGGGGNMYHRASFEISSNDNPVFIYNEAPPYPNGFFEGDDVVEHFYPEFIDSESETEYVAFVGTFATGDYMPVDHSFSMLVEAWVEGGLEANDDEATTPMNTPVTVPVLANDTLGDEPVALEDLAGPPTIVTQPPVGTATANPDGTITYTPPEGFAGEVEFQYMIERGEPLPCLYVYVEGGGPGGNILLANSSDLSPYWGAPEITIVLGSVEYVFIYQPGDDWYQGPANFPYCALNDPTPGEVHLGGDIRCAEVMAFCG